MKYIKASYNNHRKIFNIIFLIISISITLGLIISICIDKELINNIYNLFLEHINSYNKNTLSNILYPVIVYIIIFILSLTIIGGFIPVLSISIENISIGLILGTLIRNNALKGLLLGVIYFIITKLIYLIILLYLTFNIYKFIIRLLKSIKKKNNDSIYNLYSNILIKLLFSIVTITFVNLLNILIAPHIFKLFIFLI